MRSARSARRFDAVKSSTRGVPHTSPITPPRDAHFRPSSIVHSTSPASRAHTRTSLSGSTPKRFRPAPCGRPVSRPLNRSCTHSKGFPAGNCASVKPMAPASPPAANTSVSSGRPAGKTASSPSVAGLSPASPGRVKGETRRRSGVWTGASFTGFMFRFCSRHESSAEAKSQCRRVRPLPDTACARAWRPVARSGLQIAPALIGPAPDAQGGVRLHRARWSPERHP